MAHALSGDGLGLEVELKFELNITQVRKLSRLPALKAMQTARPRSKVLRATYYDTPDGNLATRNLALRVRKEGRSFVQCLKSKADDHAAVGFARNEWEWTVPGPDLNASLLRADPDIKALFKGIGFSKLTPIYATDIRRQTRELHTPGGSVVLCELDQGRVFLGDTDYPVCELELELKSGDICDLMNVAHVISEGIAGRLSNRTKAYRGFVLSQGGRHDWVKANHPPLPKQISAEDVLRISVMEGLQHLIANEDCVLSRCDIEGVHQMRIALRRMRSVITTYKKLLPKGSYEDLSQRLKDAGSTLGPARDWDVFLDEILGAVATGFEHDPDLELIRLRALERQKQAYVEADKMINSPEYARLLTDALLWVGHCAWRDGQKGGHARKLAAPATNIAKEILAKRHERLLKAGRRLQHLSIEQRHMLRIAIKKARYAAEFFADLYPSKITKSYIRSLKGLQQSLGHLNDLATAERLMADLTRSARGEPARQLHRAAGMVEGWYMHAQTLREDDLLNAWKRFRKAKAFW